MKQWVSGSVRLDVFNTRGQIVDVRVDGFRSRGTHMAKWNPIQLPSGTYYYRIMTNGYSEIKKMIILT